MIDRIDISGYENVDLPPDNDDQLAQSHYGEIANEYDQVVVQVADLTARLKAVTKERDELDSEGEALDNEIVKLQALGDAMAEALKHYANKKEWSTGTIQNPWKLVFNSSNVDGDGWKIAEDALKPWLDMRGKA